VDIQKLEFYEWARAMMFAHEASYDCIFCGTLYCYGECRNDGTDIVYGGDKRNLEVVSPVQATSGTVGGLPDRQEQERRPVRPLPEMSEGLPSTTKAHTRYRIASRYGQTQQVFDTSGAMEFF